MFNATGFDKVYNGVGDTQGETNGFYAALTQNNYSQGLQAFDPNSDSADTTFPSGIDTGGSPVYVPSPDAPANSGGGFDIGGFLASINNLGSAVVATSRNVASDIRATRSNLTNLNQPASVVDQFNAMPLVEKLAIGVALFFVLRFAVHKL